MDNNRLITLPIPWSAQFSKSRNLVYYFNHETGDSVWAPPNGSTVGGVIISSSNAINPDGQPNETKQSQADTDKLAVPAVGLVTLPSVDDHVGDWFTNSISRTCPTSTSTTKLSSSICHDLNSVDAGSETVTSSISRRKCDNQSSKEISKTSSSAVTTKACTTASEPKRDATPAASRMKRLQNLLVGIQSKKKLGGLSSASASTSPSNTESSPMVVGGKRCRGEVDVRGKRRRLEGASNADSDLTAETCSDAVPRCMVTSTTVGSGICRDIDNVSSDNIYRPVSPEPGEKLPYLDTDTDDARSSSPSSKVVTSALSLPNARQATSHRKEHPRNETFGIEKICSVDKSPRPVQHACDNNENNVTCKIGERPQLRPVKKLFFDKLSVNCIPNVKVSAQSRLSKGSSDTDNNPDIACRTEGASRTCLSTSPHSYELTDRNSAPNSSISGRRRFSRASSGSGKRSVTSGSGEESPVPPKKHLSKEPVIVNKSSNTRVSVHSRLEACTSNKGSGKRSVTSGSGEESPVPPKKHLSKEPVIVNKSSNTRVSVHSRLEACTSNKASLANAPSTGASKTNVPCETGKVTNTSTPPAARPNDLNLPAITKFRERVAVLSPDKILESTKYVPSDSIYKNSTSFSLPKFKVADKLSKCNSLGSVWEPSGDPCPADASVRAEENMEVDVPVIPEAVIESDNNHPFNDVGSTVSFSSVMPATSSKCSNELKKWLYQCEPPSPTRNYDFFLAEELTDHEESDEAMEWDDVDDDLSQVVSVMPTKSAKADEWFIVVDTNILLHSVNIVEELRDTPFPHLGLPVLIIPWLVLQELDGLKAQRNQYKGKDLALVSKARRAVQFLNNNLKKCHPRVRGQTALESEFEHYKREGADDGILQCCLQLKEKNNLAVILTNDKNLANKAIVSGVSSFTGDEIMAKLHEMGLQLQSSNTKKPGQETAIAKLLTSNQTDLEKTKIDLVFCHLKLLLKDILTEVLTSGMKKMYGHIWKSRTIKKPPWTLPDVLYCILKHWSVMKEHEFRENTWPSRDGKLMSSANDMKKLLTMLQAFFKSVSQNCFDYSLSDVKNIINCSIDVCIGLTAVSFREKLIETINKLEVLRDICKEKSRETVISMLSDLHSVACNSAETCLAAETEKSQLNYVRKKFCEIWEFLTNVCGSVYDALELEHNINYGIKYEFQNVKNICDKTSHVWPHLKTLNKCFEMFEITPVEDLSEEHQLILDIYFNMKHINPDTCQQDLDDTLSPQLVYSYLARPNMRPKILQIKEAFEKFEEYLMHCIVHISENYPNFVINPAINLHTKNLNKEVC